MLRHDSQVSEYWKVHNPEIALFAPLFYAQDLSRLVVDSKLGIVDTYSVAERERTLQLQDLSDLLEQFEEKEREIARQYDTPTSKEEDLEDMISLIYCD
jgi:hypothetical protein